MSKELQKGLSRLVFISHYACDNRSITNTYILDHLQVLTTMLNKIHTIARKDLPFTLIFLPYFSKRHWLCLFRKAYITIRNIFCVIGHIIGL